MLGCRFYFEAYAKNVREKATKCSLKTAEPQLRFYWMLMNMYLRKFDVYQSTVAPNYFKSYASS